MRREGNEISKTEKIPLTDPDFSESEIHGDICSKNHYNISDGIDIEQLLSDNSKGSIDNCDIGKVDDEITWTEEISPNDPNCTKSKSFDDNCDSNNDGDRVSGEEQESDDLEGPK